MYFDSLQKNSSPSKTNSKNSTQVFLGLKLPVILLLIAVIFVGLGEKLFERFLPKYLETLGETAFIIGAFGALQNAVNALWSLPGGYFSDKIGYRNTLIGCTILAMIGYILPILVPHWITIFLGMALFTAWPAMAFPAVISLITTVLDKNQRVMGLSMHAIIRRIPMALGPVIGGILISTFGINAGIKMAMGSAFFLSIIAVGVLFRIPVEPQAHYEPLHAKELWNRMNPAMRHLLFSDILIRFCEQIPNVFVVIWCLNIAQTTPAQFGLLTAVEMATAILLYIPVAHFSDKMERKPFVLLTFVFFTLFPAALFFSKTFPMLILAFIVRGLKEFGDPTRKALIADLAPKETKARTVGLYYLIRDLTVAFGALLGGWLWSLGEAANLWAAFGFGVLGTIIFLSWKNERVSILSRE